MLYLIGTGLGDIEDISIKALKIVQNASLVILEHYTSVLPNTVTHIEDTLQCTIVLADREVMEQTPYFLQDAKHKDVVLLVVGDPFGATTHADLLLRAYELDIKVQVLHNASIMNAVGSCGVSLYHYGQTVSIPLWMDQWQPDSFYDKILLNLRHDLHTLCLLDIKVKEPTWESLAKGKPEYMPPRYMTVQEAIEQLLHIASQRQCDIIHENTKVIAALRVGTVDQVYRYGTMREMLSMESGEPLHSLIVPSTKLDDIEKTLLNKYFAIYMIE